MRFAIPALVALLVVPMPARAQVRGDLRAGISPDRPAAVAPAPFRRADDYRYVGAAVGAGLYGLGLAGLLALASAEEGGVGKVNLPLFVGVGIGATLAGGLIGSLFPRNR